MYGQGKAPAVSRGDVGEAGPSAPQGGLMAELFGSSDSDDDPPRGVASSARTASAAASGGSRSLDGAGPSGSGEPAKMKSGAVKRAGSRRREGSLPEAVRNSLAAQVRILI